MKKIIISLIVLVLVLFSYGCGDKISSEDLATERDVERFFDFIEDDDFRENHEVVEIKLDLGYNEFEEGSYDNIIEVSNRIKMSGLIVFGYRDDVVNQYDFDVKYSMEMSTKDSEGEIVQEMTMEQDIIAFFKKVDYDFIGDVYSDVKYCEKAKNYTHKTEQKVYVDSMDDIDADLFYIDALSMMEDFLEWDEDALYFIDGDKITIIQSDRSSHIEVVIKIDNDKIKSFKAVIKGSQNGSIEYIFKDKGEIKEPSNKSDYKDLTLN